MATRTTTTGLTVLVCVLDRAAGPAHPRLLTRGHQVLAITRPSRLLQSDAAVGLAGSSQGGAYKRIRRRPGVIRALLAICGLRHGRPVLAEHEDDDDLPDNWLGPNLELPADGAVAGYYIAARRATRACRLIGVAWPGRR